MEQFLQQLVNGLITGSLYALVAMGLALIYGIMYVPNFAIAAFYMFGAYATFYLYTFCGIHYLITIPIGMAILALLGVVTERVCFRPVRNAPHAVGFIVALGLMLVLENTGSLLFGAESKVIESPYNIPIPNIAPISLTYQRLFVFIASVVLAGAVYVFLTKTMTGKMIRATAQAPEAARLVGISIQRVDMIVYGLGCALAAAAGSLIGPIFYIIPAMGLMPSLKAMIVIILGGLGSIRGAIIGGFILGIAESLGAGYISSEYTDAFAFGILLLVLLFKPTGLFKK